MSTRIEAAPGLVVDWLEGEHSLQSRNYSMPPIINPHSKLTAVMRTDLKEFWNRFQFYRRNNEDFHSHKLALHAGQQIMKAIATARSALIWDSIRHHKQVRQAADSSMNVLKHHLGQLEVGADQLPLPDLLDAPFEEAIDPYTTIPISGPDGYQYQILPIFTNLAGHAINHLLEQAETTGAMALPRPGVPSGTIEPWKRVITHQST
jgi:hypothetical protein